MSAFDPLAILHALDKHGVDYVVIGGVAANAHGSPAVTNDIDVCYSRARKNLDKLAAALHDLGAKLRGPGVPEDLPFVLDAKTLEAGDCFTFTTKHGAFDVLGTPSGSDGYEGLARNAEAYNIAGLVVRIAGLDDLMAMKRAAGRPKDRLALEILGALRDEIEGGAPS